MGRLVLNDQQVPMFAGSSTGVHFISQAEQKLQMLKIHPESLPSGVYSLYLNSLSNAPPPAPFPHLAASYIAQFPPDAEQIIARAIDRWTPLYPIVHKPSTLAAFRSLLRNPVAADNDDDQLCTIHQTLLLLALGTINVPCNNPQHTHHHHPLCLSDAYYAAASTAGALTSRLPGSLPALQALVLAQLYLQLSSRYPAASHLGGTAVRLAQTLGLHRHSARFKFDPPATELRRRAWCFPLPGERSPIDPAIALFKLAAVVGDALELLYTTTRRRGGAPAKIARLQADLDDASQLLLLPRQLHTIRRLVPKVLVPRLEAAEDLHDRISYSESFDGCYFYPAAAATRDMPLEARVYRVRIGAPLEEPGDEVVGAVGLSESAVEDAADTVPGEVDVRVVGKVANPCRL
ncbi:putative 3-carboxy-muconate cycloisomerase [Diplodia seriata]|uniref:Putative 3-carboxy-muconate cycloisomerase n=1 Tax=Diplodia seriata TaxID=420778 RepID=A0A0G2DR06_9PEZI|nr:putative 3-carboxy-muconate cycloisomerase [Diplodia seriata]